MVIGHGRSACVSRKKLRESASIRTHLISTHVAWFMRVEPHRVHV